MKKAHTKFDVNDSGKGIEMAKGLFRQGLLGFVKATYIPIQPHNGPTMLSHTMVCFKTERVQICFGTF